MAITLSKTKLISKVKVVEHDPWEVLVDEFGELDHEIKLLQGLPAFKNFEVKKGELLSKLDETFDPSEKGGVEGTKYTVSFTAKRSSSKVEGSDAKKALKKILGEDVFMACIDFSITKLRDYLTAAQFEQFVSTEQTGARTLKASKV